MGDTFLAYAKELYRAGKVKEAYSMAEFVSRNDPCCLGTQRYLAVYGVHAAALKRIGLSAIDWYAVLGIQDHSTASPERITHQFVKLRKLIGPVRFTYPDQDLDPLTTAAAEEACTLLNKAYETLSDEKLRSEFDAECQIKPKEDLPPPPPPLKCSGTIATACSVPAVTVLRKGDHKPPVKLPPPPLKTCNTTCRSPIPAVEVKIKGYRRAPEKLTPPPPKGWRPTCRSSVPVVKVTSKRYWRAPEELKPSTPREGWRRTTCRSSVQVISKGFRRPSGKLLPPRSPQHWEDDDARRIRVSYRRRCRDVPEDDSSFRRSSWRQAGIW
ncbi:unnamed protein product [Linum tenue]|uniref:J domain-containing protein n=1 Tax=Linum tenue TaxID=586396 RepID=A0AAV0REJ8_9ROSI|nr:unnamed protein product [Linum tenue]